MVYGHRFDTRATGCGSYFSYRTALFDCWSCGSIGLPGGDGAARHGARGDETHGADAEYHRRANWHGPLLSRWIFSFIGGSLTLPISIYKSIVGLVLLYSAVRLFFSAATADQRKTTLVPIWLALIIGAAMGMLSGLTGVGGGIFLSPVLLLMHWAGTKETSGVSVAFILVNSIAGMLGHVSAIMFIPPAIVYWAPAALIGGWLGTELGTRILPVSNIRKWLSVVLALAGVKLMMEAILLLLGK